MVRSICVGHHNLQPNVQTENMWAYSILRFGIILPFKVFMCFGTLIILCFEGWGLYMFGRVTAESTIALIQNFTVTNMIFETILMFLLDWHHYYDFTATHNDWNVHTPFRS